MLISTKKIRSNTNTYKIKIRLIEERGFICQACENIPDRLELDHIKELWEGGTHQEDNLQLLCVDCHKKKTSINAKIRAKLYPQQIYDCGVRVK